MSPPEIIELERQFHHWLKKVAPEMKRLDGQCRMDAFTLKMQFAIARLISRQLEEVKDAITSVRSAEAVRPAKPGGRKSKPR